MEVLKRHTLVYLCLFSTDDIKYGFRLFYIGFKLSVVENINN